jgi:hypothetical protein
LVIDAAGTVEIPSGEDAMTNAAAANWIERMPWRWARNGAILALIWIACSITFTRSGPSTVRGVIVVVLFIGALGLLGWLFGLGARRRLRRIVALDDKSAHRAVIWLPGRYALVGAAIGLLFPLADLVPRWWAGKAPFGDSAAIPEEVLYGIAMPVFAAAIGGFIGVITCDQIRKRLAGRA